MKRFTSIFLIALLLFCLAGCKGSVIYITSKTTIIAETSSENSSDVTSAKPTLATSSNFNSTQSNPEKAPQKATDVILNEIVTEDGTKGTEITDSSKKPHPDSDEKENTAPSGPALPPRVEDLDNTFTPDFSESSWPDTTDLYSSKESLSQDGEDDITDNTHNTSTSNVQSGSDDSEPALKQHTPVALEDLYRYSRLNTVQKSFYRQIMTAADSVTSTITLNEPLSIDDAITALDAFIADNPAFFYVLRGGVAYHDGYGNVGKYGLIFSDGTSLNTDESGYATEPSTTLKNRILTKKAAFDNKVSRIISDIPVDIPEVEKQKLIYDHIIKKASYNINYSWNQNVPDDWTAYGVLIKNSGVCESYSEAFQTLCLAVGINCTVITGDAGGAHQWNAVQLDNEWYECDITFDDPIDSIPDTAYWHNYFNLTTERMHELNHFAYLDEPAPICTGTKYSYKNYFNN